MASSECVHDWATPDIAGMSDYDSKRIRRCLICAVFGYVRSSVMFNRGTQKPNVTPYVCGVTWCKNAASHWRADPKNPWLCEWHKDRR
jgi:hypothetical protein